jgi:hypothetical protein
VGVVEVAPPDAPDSLGPADVMQVEEPPPLLLGLRLLRLLLLRSRCQHGRLRVEARGGGGLPCTSITIVEGVSRYGKAVSFHSWRCSPTRLRVRLPLQRRDEGGLARAAHAQHQEGHIAHDHRISLLLPLRRER